jgi:hypothetical protein
MQMAPRISGAPMLMVDESSYPDGAFRAKPVLSHMCVHTKPTIRLSIGGRCSVTAGTLDGEE